MAKAPTERILAEYREQLHLMVMRSMYGTGRMPQINSLAWQLIGEQLRRNPNLSIGKSVLQAHGTQADGTIDGSNPTGDPRHTNNPPLHRPERNRAGHPELEIHK